MKYLGYSAAQLLFSAAALVVVALPVCSRASEPAYDCARASGKIEQLICSDDTLAALDQKLAGVYAAALANFPQDELHTLKVEQRGWIKGRDDCSKADEVSACVSREYRQRIVELQIKSGLLMAPAAVGYDCGDDDKGPFFAAFYNDTDPPSVVLTSGDVQVIAFIARSASGARYTAAGVELWEHHGEARVNWFGTERRCRAIR